MKYLITIRMANYPRDVIICSQSCVPSLRRFGIHSSKEQKIYMIQSRTMNIVEHKELQILITTTTSQRNNWTTSQTIEQNSLCTKVSIFGIKTILLLSSCGSSWERGDLGFRPTETSGQVAEAGHSYTCLPAQVDICNCASKKSWPITEEARKRETKRETSDWHPRYKRYDWQM